MKERYPKIILSKENYSVIVLRDVSVLHFLLDENNENINIRKCFYKTTS